MRAVRPLAQRCASVRRTWQAAGLRSIATSVPRRQWDTTLECEGCGFEASGKPSPKNLLFRCPEADNSPHDHILVPRRQPYPKGGDDPNPLLRFREQFYAYRLARSEGMSDEAYCDLVQGVDAAIRERSGAGFVVRPAARVAGLEQELGCQVWLKDETKNPGGSHKARHLVGPLLYLEVLRHLKVLNEKPTLAIASCGNAAIAAATVACAQGYTLEAYVPQDVAAETRSLLEHLGADVNLCPRLDTDPAGDPCVLRMIEALQKGRLPLACQGDQCGLNVESGQLMIWEFLSNPEVTHLDHVVFQVGGGAFGSSAVRALRAAVDAGRLPRMPMVHTVQTNSCAPLKRALEKVQALEQKVGADQALQTARAQRGDFMRAWESEPHSVAHGILDDETYDWHALVSATVQTQGTAQLVEEEDFLRARDHVHAQGIQSCITGASGLAGVMTMRRNGVIQPTDAVGVVVSGMDRGEADTATLLAGLKA